MTGRARAIVFANNDVGVRCLSALLAAGVEVPLVVTHENVSSEALAFESVEAAAISSGLAVTKPDDARDPVLARRLFKVAPDFIFSFYYRQMLPVEILQSATRGALNMHGSLLPRYRGRAPVNWAVVRGETQTGATLHYMTEKADAGDIVDQEPVPISPDETAFEVFRKVTAAAERVMSRSLPALLQGNAPRTPQDPAAATYFGRRRPEDGRIDWDAGAKAIHDLVRGVAPPYPGAYTKVRGHKLRLLRTFHEIARKPCTAGGACMYFENSACFIDCPGGGVLQVIRCDLDGRPIAPFALKKHLEVRDFLPLASTPLKGSA